MGTKQERSGQTPSNDTAMPTSPTKTVYKQYISTFVDVERHRWALLITYPDTEATRSYPDIQVVTLGVPPVTISIDRDDALAPIAEGRLAFSLLQETPEHNYRHLMQAPEGSVSVMLLLPPESVPSEKDEDLMKLPSHLYANSDGWEKGYWRGTLDPESYKEPANQHSGYLVSFEASDFGRLKRIELRKTDERIKVISPRMSVRNFIAAIISLSFSEPEQAWIQDDSFLSGDTATTARVQMSWCARHFTYDGSEIYVTTSPFFEDPESPLTAFEALDRILRALSLTLEQAEGIWVITDIATLQSAEEDKYTFPALNGDGYLTLNPEELRPMGSDGEISALPARGQITLTSVSHIAKAIPALPIPGFFDEGRWHLVPRADTRLKLPAWRYQAGEDPRVELPGVSRLDTEEISVGEDRQLFMLVWNPKSIHGRIDHDILQTSEHAGWSIFLVDEVGWEYSPESKKYINRSLRAVSDDLRIELISRFDRPESFTYTRISSFAVTNIIPESNLIHYLYQLSSWQSRLNSSLETPGLPLRGVDGWRLDLPSVANMEGLSLRLDLPLMVSMGQDLYQDLTENNFVTIDMMGDTPGGRQLDWVDRQAIAKFHLDRLKAFTDAFTGCRLSFALVAKGEKDTDPAQYLGMSVKGQLSWSDSQGRLPYLSYGSSDGESKMKWGSSWNHPNIGDGDYLGEGMHIPLPPKRFHHLELTIYSNPHFFRKEGDKVNHYQKWSLWSVPSIIALQAPALWLSDPLGRKDRDLSPDRKERYRFTRSTDEGQDEELHLSDGTGLARLDPAIIRTTDGTPLIDKRRGEDDGFRSTSLMGYRAECFGAIYGALPDRGYELTGTFRYRQDISRSIYAGHDWITVSREIDLQAQTERGTYHQLRPASTVSPDALKPEVLEGVQSRGETYDTSSPRYVERGPRPPRTRRR